MLISFFAKNFLSINKEIELNLIADKNDSTSYLDRVIEVPINSTRTKKVLPLLKTALIYGPNASGKTNLLKAIEIFSRFIKDCVKMHDSDKTPFIPFMLNSESKKEPSEFEIKIVLDGTVYRYGFSANKISIIDEWLFIAEKGPEKVIFERHTDGDDVKWTFGHSGKDFAKLKKEVRINSLMLSVGSIFNVFFAKNVFSFIEKIETYKRIQRVFPEEADIPVVSNLLKHADIGIESIGIESIDIPAIDDKDIPDEIPKEVFNFLMSNFKKHFSEIRTFNFLYKDNNDKVVSIDEDYQSEGTLRFLNILNKLLSMKNAGGVLICDEFGTSLHPMLTAYLFDALNKICKNTQFICTTHNTILLGSDGIRKDQIYLTEKNIYGETELKSISDYKYVRNDARLEKQYLEGRFGALPFIDNDLSCLMENGDEHE